MKTKTVDQANCLLSEIRNFKNILKQIKRNSECRLYFRESRNERTTYTINNKILLQIKLVVTEELSKLEKELERLK